MRINKNLDTMVDMQTKLKLKGGPLAKYYLSRKIHPLEGISGIFPFPTFRVVSNLNDLVSLAAHAC